MSLPQFFETLDTAIPLIIVSSYCSYNLVVGFRDLSSSILERRESVNILCRQIRDRSSQNLKPSQIGIAILVYFATSC